MLVSHILDETTEPSQIRVYSHYSPLNIFFLNASSSRESFDSSEVYLNTASHLLLIDVHQPIYPNLFTERSTLANVSNIFDHFLASTICQHIQLDDVLQSPIWEGGNHLTSPLPKTLLVDSIHSRESK